MAIVKFSNNELYKLFAVYSDFKEDQGIEIDTSRLKSVDEVIIPKTGEKIVLIDTRGTDGFPYQDIVTLPIQDVIYRLTGSNAEVKPVIAKFSHSELYKDYAGYNDVKNNQGIEVDLSKLKCIDETLNPVTKERFVTITTKDANKANATKISEGSIIIPFRGDSNYPVQNCVSLSIQEVLNRLIGK